MLPALCVQPCFAVIETGGSQWKVTADDVIYHNKIPGAHVNDVLEFNKVLLLGTRDDTTIGRPFVPGASVVAAVEETFKDAKVRGTTSVMLLPSRCVPQAAVSCGAARSLQAVRYCKTKAPCWGWAPGLIVY